jgi:hypothetical protein
MDNFFFVIFHNINFMKINSVPPVFQLPKEGQITEHFQQAFSKNANVHNIQGVPGGMDKTSGECSLC